MQRVIVIDDEPAMTSLLKRGLSYEGFAVDTAASGQEGLALARDRAPDAVVLDVMMPGIDGLETLRRLRAADARLPVLLLTGKDAPADQVQGLDAGADDYLTKPFSFEELLARLRALTRRAPAERPAVLEVGRLRLDPGSHRAWLGRSELELSLKEFALLELFMRRPGVTLSREHLLERGWDIAFEHRSNVVDVYIGYLRAKIDRPFGRASIETVRGTGYRLRDDGG